MATGSGGGSPYGHGGEGDGHGGEGDRHDGGRSGGGGSGVDKGAIDLDTDDARESMYSSEVVQMRVPEEGSSQLATASQCTPDPLSHYLPDHG